MKTVLITGATGGIGYEISKRFAKDKFKLVLVGRNREKLERVKLELEEEYKIKVYTIVKDLTIVENIDEIYREVKALNIEVTHLVNNAGYGLMGSFEKIDMKKQEEMININIITLTKLTYLFLEDMKKNKYGKILNVASLASFTPGPYMAVYYASKAFVMSFSRGLQEELRFSGITVTALCPGATKTNFGKRAEANNSLLFLVPMSAKRVARVGYLGMKSGVDFIIPGVINNIFALWLKLTPAIINNQFVKISSIKFKKENNK